MAISNRLAIIIVVLGACLAYGNTLFNGFVGDDNMLIVNNTAYRSWDNFTRLLFKDYIIDIDDILNGETKFHGSSDVSYRPVKSATHFIDYALWQLNPLGYHLNNLILHAVNAVLVFIFLNSIFKNQKIALLSALFFAVHPIQSETVSSINFRHNLLLVFFTMAAMLSYAASFKSKKVLWLFVSYVMFFCAVFSKEAAIILPILIIGYDGIIKGKSVGEIAKGFIGRYFGFFVVMVFFLYAFVYVFPNVVSEKVGLFGGAWTTHVVYLVHIFIYYLKSFVFPWSVKSLPPLFNIEVETLWGLGTYLGICAVLAMIWLYAYYFKQNRKLCFLIFWFMASYIVVSNIVPFVNPISFRFMYLPSIGVFAILAFYIDRVMVKIGNSNLGTIVQLVLIFFCATWAWPLNTAWRSDYTMTLKMYRDFPQNPRANMYAGMTYFHLKDYAQAARLLNYALELGLEDPRLYHYLGIIYMGDPKRTEPLFTACVKKFPRYATCYAGLGRVYFLDGLNTQAMNHFTINRSLVANYPTYGYLIQLYLMAEDRPGAEAALKEAEGRLTDQDHVDSLKKLFAEDPARFPIDIGF